MMLFGPPGAGKGTHSPKIVDKMGVPSLSTGDMLREAVSKGTEVGLKAKALMESGGLVGDDIVVGIIKDRITEADCSKGFILDGFPRTVKQAEMLDDLLKETGDKVESVIEFNVPDATLEERICGRWIHKASGRSYHVKFNPPKSLGGKEPSAETMKDDETGEACMQRADDTAEALVKRLKSYHDETVPILNRYKTVAHKVNANQKIDAVWEDTEECLPMEGVVDMKVTMKKGASFYVRAATTFLKGAEGREASEGKEALPALKPVDELKVSGLGEAVNVAVTVASRAEADGLAKIVKIKTRYPEMTSGRGCGQIMIHLKRI